MDPDVDSITLERYRAGTAIALSVLVHLLVFAAIILTMRLPTMKESGKRGDTLMVELQNPAEPAPLASPAARPSPPPGVPGRPARPGRPEARAPRASAPPAPAAKSAPRVVARAEKREPEAPAPPRPTAPPPPVAKPAEKPVEKPAPAAPEVAAKTPDVPTDAQNAPASEPPRAAAPAAPTTPEPVREAHTSAAPQAEGSKGAAGRPRVDIRSALAARGGGGGGGAGGGAFGSFNGRPGGRGGIEGEPIPLDSDDPRFAEYLRRLKQAIEAKMTYPCIKNDRTRECEYKDAQLILEFGILKSGELKFIDLRRSSGMPIYDDYSANAIRLASPFPSPPPAMVAAMKEGSTGVAILGHFHYVYEVTLRGMLR